MMLDIMPSEPLPAITFSTLGRYFRASTLAQRPGRHWGRGSDGPGFAASDLASQRRGAQGILVRRELGDALQAILALDLFNAAPGHIRLQGFDIRGD